MASLVKTTMLILVLVLATRCTNDPVLPDPSATNIQNETGWRVTWFWDQDKEETSDFSDYTFYFHANGTLEAKQGSASVSGTWRTTTDDGSQRLVLSLSTLKPLSELNDDWIILEMNNNVIRLKDDNEAHLEELHFEAN